MKNKKKKKYKRCCYNCKRKWTCLTCPSKYSIDYVCNKFDFISFLKSN